MSHFNSDWSTCIPQFFVEERTGTDEEQLVTWKQKNSIKISKKKQNTKVTIKDLIFIWSQNELDV
jgi:hypothetical protein